MILENFDEKSKKNQFIFFAYSVRSRRVRKPNGLIFKISSRYSRERTGQSWKNAIFKKPFFVIFRRIKNCKNALNLRPVAGFSGVSFWPLPYEKMRKSRILQKSLISAKKHEISSFITLRTHVDRCKFNQRHKTNSFYHLKNPHNLPKSDIFAESWIFAFFHMGEVKNWPPKKA